MATAALEASPRTARGIRQDPFPAIGAKLLLAVLMASVTVAWSPRYWPVTVLDAGIFALGMVWMVRNAMAPRRGSWSRLYIPAAMLGIWGAVQLAVGSSVYAFETTRALLYWSANAVALFLGGQCLRAGRVRKSFLTGLAYFTGAIAVIGILQYFTSPYRIYWMFPISQHGKAVGPFVYRNQFAAMVELVLPIVLYRVMSERRHRWVSTGLAAVLFAVVVATASRAGTVLVAAEMVLIFMLGWWRGMLSRRMLAMVCGQVAALALAFTLVVGFQEVWSRFKQSNPYALRGKLTQSTLRMIRARPVMGWGLGTWQTVYPEFATFDNSLYANEAHNDWAQWTAEGGLPFGLVLALMAAGAAILAWRNIWGMGVVFVFLHSTIDYPLREPVIGATLFVLAGAMIGADFEGVHRSSLRARYLNKSDANQESKALAANACGRRLRRVPWRTGRSPWYKSRGQGYFLPAIGKRGMGLRVASNSRGPEAA